MKFATSDRRGLRLASAALAAVTALGLMAGCSSTPQSSATPDATGASVDPFAPEQATVKGILYRQTSSAPWFAGLTEGYPAEYGIELEHEFGESSPAILTALVGGSGQVAQVSIPSIIDATSQGIKVVIIGEAFRDAVDSQLLMALPDSGIESIEDLHGKKVGLVGLNSGHHNRIRYVMGLEDIDYSDVEFVNLTYGEMGAALQTGAIDAGVFTGAALADARESIGAVEVFDFGDGPLKGISSLQWVALADWAQANPNTVAAFQCAIVERGETLVEEDDEAYYAASTGPELGFDRAVLESIPKVTFPAANDPEVMQLNAKIQYEVGLSPEEFDISSITVPLPTNCE